MLPWSDMIRGKLASAVWFLKRPKLYPQFLHLVKLTLFSQVEPDTRAASERWCESLAVSIPEAVAQVTGQKMGMPIQEKFKDLFKTAEAKAASCTVVMGGPGALDLLYYVADSLKAERVIETGVAYGWSSLALLLALRNRKGAKLVSTDMPYVQGNNDAYVGLVVPAELSPFWEIIKLADRQALPQALERLPTLDLCHYDSDKTYVGRMWAYPLLWQALRKNGCFISDDINDNIGFKDFSEKLGVKPIVVRVGSGDNIKYVGILTKT